MSYFTPQEVEALEVTGQLSQLLCEIIYTPYRTDTGSDSHISRLKSIADDDWAEAAQEIHVLQRKIASQAAARLADSKVRLLGHPGNWS